MTTEINNENQPEKLAVNDKRTDPPGVMRKSIQSWIILAIAVLMLLVIWLTGGTKAKSAPPESKPSPVPANTGGGSDDIARRLLAEQREQARSLSAQASSVPKVPIDNLSGQQPSTSPQAQAREQSQPVDPIAEEQRRRKYTSLFSSSIALSYREPQTRPATSPGPQQQPTLDQLAAALAGLPTLPAPQPSMEQPNPLVPNFASAQPPAAPVSSNSVEHRSPPANPNLSSGKDYTIFEGTFLSTVLVNRLNGDFSGPVICMTANDVYSQDRQHLLIPAGSKLIGETKKVDAFGQRRLGVSFHRLIMPDGYSLDLDRFQGLNQVGQTGLKDQVNNHYLQIFGASVAIGAIGGLAELGTQATTAGVPQSSNDVYRQGVATSLSQSSLHVLDRFLNILPTITIREGHRVEVYLTQDLLVPDYTRHEMPGNI